MSSQVATAERRIGQAAPLQDPMIELSGVSHVFRVRDTDDRRAVRDFVALQDLDLVVPAGDFLTLVGPSGCGKSTVLDIMGGLTRPTSGTVSVDGREVSGPGLDRGIVFQQYALLPWRTARGNVEFALEAAGELDKPGRRERAAEVLHLVGLDGFEDRHPHELSGGMKQRVAIARSLSYEPQVLLMDEPFGALDAQTRESLQEELLAICRRRDTTVVFVTHDIDEAVYLGRRVAVMAAMPGRVVQLIDTPLLPRGDGGDVRSTAEFAHHRHLIWSLIRGQGGSRA